MLKKNMLSIKGFSPPVIKQHLVKRNYFAQAFEFAISKPLTIVMAPAGYGKTTSCIAALSSIDHIESRWIGITDQHNDSYYFTSQLIDVLASFTDAEFESQKLSFSSGEVLSPMHRIDALFELLDDRLSQYAKQLVLVFDDYHHVHDSSIDRLVSYLIDNAPIYLRIVIVSRTAPKLDEKYATQSSECTYLTQEYCKFSKEESAGFLKEYSRMDLSDHYLEQIYKQCNGWPLALQLIVIHLKLSTENAVDVVATKNISQLTSDFFQKHIFAKLSIEMQTLLSDLSCLQVFSAPLMDAVLATNKVSGVEILRELEEKNLFITKTEDKEGWYKFHDLFRDFLRNNAFESNTDILKRAANWFICKNDFYSAIDYFLEARAYEEAADYIEVQGSELLRRSEFITLLGWIDRLPAAIKNTRPKILLLQSWCIPDSQKPFLCPAILDQLEILLIDWQTQIDLGKIAHDSDLCGELKQLKADYLLSRSYTEGIQGEHAKSVDTGLEALSLINEQILLGRARCYCILAQSFYFLGEHEKSIEYFEYAIQFSMHEDNAYILIVSLAFLSQVYLIAGKMKSAINVTNDCVAWLNANGYKNLPMTTAARTQIAETYREMDELAKAHTMLQDALDYCRTDIPKLQEICIYIANMRYCLSTKEYDKALHYIDKIDETGPSLDSIKKNNVWTFGTPSTSSLRAAISVMKGNIHEALLWADENKQVLLDRPSFVNEAERLILCRIWVASGKIPEALELCASVKREATEQGRKLHQAQCLIIETVAAVLVGDSGSAQQSFEQALLIGMSCGFKRLFLDAEPFLLSLLDWAKSNPTVKDYVTEIWGANTGQGGCEDEDKLPEACVQLKLKSLTRRENSVIALLAEGESNKGIARKLNIAPDTASKFVKKILKKLEVRNRTEAAMLYKSAS